MRSRRPLAVLLVPLAALIATVALTPGADRACPSPAIVNTTPSAGVHDDDAVTRRTPSMPPSVQP